MCAGTELASFYACPAVQERILEYCGAVGRRPLSMTAWAIAGFGGRRRLSEPDGGPVPCESQDAMVELMADGADIARSVGDERGNLILLDVDYVSPFDPAEGYREPERVFAKLEPVYRVLRELFSEYGLRPLVLLTGQGYHFVSRVASTNSLHRPISDVGHVGAPLQTRYESRRAWRPDLPSFGRAHDGIGRMLEFLCHRAMVRLRGRTDVPVKIADVRTGDHPFICLDLSAYGDPLYERYTRCAFSGNQKAPMSEVGRQEFTISLPRGKYGLRTLLEARRHPSRARELARSLRARIPDAPKPALSRWLDDYVESSLAAFHRFFDEGWHDDPSTWHATYDRVQLEELPEDMRRSLAQPNPDLMKPENVRAVALYFWEKGWHPRAIAGLVRSKYERDFGWGDYWYRYDASQRADFYVRTLCGAAAGGVDPDMNFLAPRWVRRQELHEDVSRTMISGAPRVPFTSPS